MKGVEICEYKCLCSGNMLKFLYKFVTPWAIASKSQILKNRILGRIANYLYPTYCKIVNIENVKHSTGRITNEQVIISLTSFPARIDKVYLCIQSILRQLQPADKVILWLADSQFQDRDGIPDNLKCLEDKGLEIRFCDDLRSYKKIFYTAKEYSDSIIVTIDDDTLYPEDWLERMLIRHMQYKDCVVCYRAHRITFIDNNVAPYKQWIGMSPGELGPSMELVPIGVGGVLYPRHYFDGIDIDVSIIRKLCPTTDDLWLKVIGIKRGYKAIKVDANSKEWFTILNSQDNSLVSVNVSENVNDESLRRLIDYYEIDIGDIREEE